MQPEKISGRRWTDASLASAVRDSRSWREVSSRLAMSTSAGTRLRLRAEQLRMDTAHFRGNQRWSETDLRCAIGRAAGWSEVATALRLRDSPETRRRVKGYAVRKHISLDHLDEQVRAEDHSNRVGISGANTGQLRYAAESIAAAWFTLRNVSVTLPICPQRYDLVIWLPEGPRRVQVKTGTYRAKHETWKICIGHRPHIAESSMSKIPYEVGAFDLLFVIDGEFEIYLIPNDAVCGLVDINVGAYREYRVGSAASLLS